MFDFMENFFSRSIDTVRTALYLLVMGLAIYAGISKKSFVAFITTAAIGGLAVWMISPAGFNIFPGLFDRSASDVTNVECKKDDAGRVLGWVYINGVPVDENNSTYADAANPGDPYAKPANRVGFHCQTTSG